MKLGIYIPSRGRAGMVSTTNSIPNSKLADTHIVCTHGEKKLYAAVYRYRKLVEAPASVDTIGKKRDYIVKHAIANGYTHIVMLDDDLVFARRRLEDPTKFSSAENWDCEEVFRLIEKQLTTHVHVGVLGREGGNRITDPVVFNTRMMRVLAYDLDIIKSQKIKFAVGDLMCDFDVTLKLLRAGYSNAVIANYVQNQAKSNAPGGCSTYRTMERQREGALTLAKLHPEYVKVVEKTTKGAWGGGTRTDVVVSWKKAYNSGASANV